MQGASGDASACRAATRSLTSLLESHIAAGGSGGSAGGAADSSAAIAARDAALIDANIARLTQRIRHLESDLQDARSELQAAQMRRAQVASSSTSQAKGRSGGAGSSAGAGGATPRALTDRLNAQIDAALGIEPAAANGVDASSRGKDELRALLDGCARAARLQHKAIERQAEQLTWARNRVTAATNLGDPKKAEAARAKVQEAEAHGNMIRGDAGKIEQLVIALEATLNTSDAFAALRPVAMQIKQAVWQVYSVHNGQKPAADEGASIVGKRTYTMEEILSAGTKLPDQPPRAAAAAAATGSAAAAAAGGSASLSEQSRPSSVPTSEAYQPLDHQPQVLSQGTPQRGPSPAPPAAQQSGPSPPALQSRGAGPSMPAWGAPLPQGSTAHAHGHAQQSQQPFLAHQPPMAQPFGSASISAAGSVPTAPAPTPAGVPSVGGADSRAGAAPQQEQQQQEQAGQPPQRGASGSAGLSERSNSALAAPWRRRRAGCA